MVQFAISNRGGAHHQSAIRNRCGQSVILLRITHHFGRAHRRNRFAKGYFVRIDNPQLREPKVAQRTGGSADIEGVTRGYQNDAQVFEIAWRGQATILTGDLPRAKPVATGVDANLLAQRVRPGCPV